MRRPALTKAQRHHAKQQRALLTLRRASVRWSVATDRDYHDDVDSEALIGALTDMQIAADKYTETLSTREKRRLLK